MDARVRANALSFNMGFIVAATKLKVRNFCDALSRDNQTGQDEQTD